MSKKTYRVIQWATGTVGKLSLKHIIENPYLELAGVLVTNPEKVGKDAGELVGLPATGVVATNDVEAILALDADCVLFCPMLQDVDMVCRLLRSGKNVVSTIGPFYRTKDSAAIVDRIEAAAKEGGASFHGCGIHPGFAGDVLPITLLRLMDRVDRVEVYEIADKLVTPSVYIEFMGFGSTLEELSSKPNIMETARVTFGESMAMVCTALGKEPGEITEVFEVAYARNDIPHPTGVIRKGTIAAQHWEWTMMVEGKPLFVYHHYYTMGNDTEPQWNLGESRHRVLLYGHPDTEVTLKAIPDENGISHFHGITWTAFLGTTAIPGVCDAAPGVVTHFDLGLIKPKGLVR